MSGGQHVGLDERRGGWGTCVYPGTVKRRKLFRIATECNDADSVSGVSRGTPLKEGSNCTLKS